MPLHHTEDPGIRAADIAANAGKKIWHSTGDPKLADDIQRATYEQSLLELAGQPAEPEERGINEVFFLGLCGDCCWDGS